MDTQLPKPMALVVNDAHASPEARTQYIIDFMVGADCVLPSEMTVKAVCVWF